MSFFLRLPPWSNNQQCTSLTFGAVFRCFLYQSKISGSLPIQKKENKISGSLTTLRLHIDGLLGLLNGVYGHRSKEPYSPQLLLDWDVGKREREIKVATCQTWGSEKSK